MIEDPGGRADVMDGAAGIVTSIGFPWGVRCMVCGEPIPEGSAYVSRLSEYQCDDPDCVHAEIACAACGLLGGTS